MQSAGIAANKSIDVVYFVCILHTAGSIPRAGSLSGAFIRSANVIWTNGFFLLRNDFHRKMIDRTSGILAVDLNGWCEADANYMRSGHCHAGRAPFNESKPSPSEPNEKCPLSPTAPTAIPLCEFQHNTIRYQRGQRLRKYLK